MACNGIGWTALDKKKPETLDFLGFRLRFGPDWTDKWWRWAELNRRPKALHPQHYMLSSPLNLIPEQHGVQSAPGNQPVVF